MGVLEQNLDKWVFFIYKGKNGSEMDFHNDLAPDCGPTG